MSYVYLFLSLKFLLAQRFWQVAKHVAVVHHLENFACDFHPAAPAACATQRQAFDLDLCRVKAKRPPEN